MIIEKKAWPIYFNEILNGKKTYDFRLADWECSEGDTLILKEWDPQTKTYTGRKIEKIITYASVFKLEDLPWSEEEIKKHGFLIISLK